MWYYQATVSKNPVPKILKKKKKKKKKAHMDFPPTQFQAYLIFLHKKL